MRHLHRVLLTVALLAPAALASAAVAQSLLAPDVEAVQAESAQAARLHVALVSSYGDEYRDAGLAAYVGAVGARLVSHAGPAAAGFDFRFTVLDSPRSIAFSVPGGYVYVARGILALADSEAELAAILAHEVAHVILRHGAQRNRFSHEHPSISGAQLMAAHAALSREQELEADAASIPLLLAAGYDPAAQLRFVAAIGRQIDMEVGLGMWSLESADREIHPSTAERSARVSAALAANASGGADRRNEFLAAIDGLVFGAWPTQGMLLRDTYVDTTVGITFTLPPCSSFAWAGASAPTDRKEPSCASRRAP